jgi:hypothetical protein
MVGRRSATSGRLGCTQRRRGAEEQRSRGAGAQRTWRLCQVVDPEIYRVEP